MHPDSPGWVVESDPETQGYTKGATKSPNLGEVPRGGS